MTGTDEDGEFYKVVDCFMIIGTESSTPRVIHQIHEFCIDGSWIKIVILKFMEKLKNVSSVILGVVCDNHAGKVAVYRFLLKEKEQQSNDW